MEKSTIFDRVGGRSDRPGLAIKEKIIIIGNQIIYDKYPFETLRSSFHAFACAADTVSLLGDGLSYHQKKRLAEISQELLKIYKELNSWQINEKQLELGLEN